MSSKNSHEPGKAAAANIRQTLSGQAAEIELRETINVVFSTHVVRWLEFISEPHFPPDALLKTVF